MTMLRAGGLLDVLADFLTKALPKREFEVHQEIVMNSMWFLSRIVFDFLIFYFFMFLWFGF